MRLSEKITQSSTSNFLKTLNESVLNENDPSKLPDMTLEGVIGKNRYIEIKNNILKINRLSIRQFMKGKYNSFIFIGMSEEYIIVLGKNLLNIIDEDFDENSIEHFKRLGITVKDNYYCIECTDNLEDKFTFIRLYEQTEEHSTNSLQESVSNEPMQVYMNTWGNYNVNGGDASPINGGWMSPEQAKTFIEQHKDEEPFINDTDNVPFDGINEYDNPTEVVDKLIQFEQLDDSKKPAFKAMLETSSNPIKDFDEYLKKLNDGDYIFFPNISTDDELGRAYVDMVGISGVSNIDSYIDRDALIKSYEDADEREYDDDELENVFGPMADEDIELAKLEGNTAWLEEYFDYERLGRDLSFSDYNTVSNGIIQIIW